MSDTEPPDPDDPLDRGEVADPRDPTGEVPAVSEEELEPELAEELEPEPRASRRQRSDKVRRRRRQVGLGILAFVVVIVLAFVSWYELESHALGSAGKDEIVHVTSGESVGSVTSALSEKKVIGSSLAFRLYGLVHGSPTLTPGSFLFHQNQSFSQVHSILDAAPNVQAVTVVPGYTLSEIATQVGNLSGYSGNAFEQVAKSGAVHSMFSAAGSDNLEGLLGSGTYIVLPGESDTTLLTDMVDQFDRQAQAAGLSTKSAAALGVTPYQVVTVASVVQKEGYYAVNMPKVARVIYNRLGNGMPLQMDSTVLYALGQDGGTVTPQDLKLQTPYNTYLNTGLPPTPICTPSPTALAAAVHPPPGGWLYFELVKKNGTMAFSDTFAGQLANEKLAQSRGLG